MRHRHALIRSQASQEKGVKNPGAGPGLGKRFLLIRQGFAGGLITLMQSHSD